MLTARLSGLVLASVLVFACGGKKQPITPDKETATADAGPDMPSDPTSLDLSDAGSPTTTTSTPPKKDPPPSIALPAASAKITVKKKAIEIKADGSVMVAGKAAGKLSGADMQDPDGKALMSVAADGAVTTADGTNVGSFQGDDLVLTTGDKYAVADDGTLTITTGGKGATAGKATGIGTAKRALVLAAYFAGRNDAAAATPPVKVTPPKKTTPKKK